METYQEQMAEFQTLLEKGMIQKAYLGLIQYILNLHTYLQKKYPEHSVSGLYQGYMDMTYFSFTPESLQARKLKVAIVFVYEKFRFEVWLAAANKQVQTRYWEMIRQSGWNKYQLVPKVKGYDSILEHVLVEDPDFSNLDSLTEKIESKVLEFVRDVVVHLQLVERQT